MMSKLSPVRFAAVCALILCAVLFLTFKSGFVSKAEKKPAALLAPSITATDNDALVTDADGDGIADPGDTIEYTVTVTNGAAAGAGNDATGMSFNDTLDANMTLVPGSVQSSPIAGSDSFNVLGNVSISVPDGASDLLGNDIDPDTGSNAGLTASGGTTTVQGGNLTINTNGSFTYNPPPGFEGADSFTYTVMDGNGNASTGTVTLNVSGMIWFIDNNAAACTTLAAGCGRLSNPFSTLAAFVALNNGAGNNPAINDNIFVYESATAYTAANLLSGQKLIGQDATATLATISGVSVPSFSATLPAMNTGGNATTFSGGAGTGVSLNTANASNTLRGFSIGNSTPGLFGNNFGTLTLSEVSVNSNSQAVNLSAGTANATFTSVTSTGGGTNVNLTNIAGTLDLGTGALSGAASSDFFINQGTANVTYAGTITTGTSIRPVEIDNKTGGTVTFSGLVSTAAAQTSAGILLSTNTGATINFTGGVQINSGGNAAFTAIGGGTVNATQNNTSIVNTLTTTSGTALNIQNTTIGASNATFRSISSNGGTATGIILVNTGSTGSLIVTGDGGTAKGGNGTGGTIANKTGGADGDGTTASAVYINNGAAALRNMTFTRLDNFGIYGLSVNNVTLQYATVGAISGTACADADGDIGTSTGAQDAAIVFGKSNPSGLSGFNNGAVVLLDNLLVRCSIEHQVEMYQQNNTFTATVSNSDIKDNSTSGGGDGVQVEMQGTAGSVTPVVINVNNNSFDDNKSQMVQGAANDNSVLDMTVNGNNGIRSTQGNEGIVLSNGNNGKLTTHITNNTISGFGGASIFAGQTPGNANALAGNAVGLTAVIKGNNVTAPTSATNHTIDVLLTSTVGQISRANILIESNTIAQNSTTGVSRPFLVDTPDANTSPTFTATVINNNVTAVDAGTGTSANVTARRGAGCFDIRNNAIAGPFGITARQQSVVGETAATVQLEQGVSGSAVAATVMDDNHPAGTVTSALGTISVVGNNTCQTAPTIVSPIEEGMFNTNNASNNDLSSINTTYQTPSEMLASIKPFVKPSVKSETISNEAALAANEEVAANENTAKAESATKESGYWKTVAAFFGEVSDKLGAAISPTVAAQGKKEIPVSISGETITVNGSGAGFTLPASKAVTIKFRATINSPIPGVTQVSNQGTISGSNFGNVLTDDPSVGGAANPTVTLIDTTTVAITSSQNPSIVGQSVTFTATLTGAPVHAAGNPIGTVQFLDGGNPIGSPVAVVAGAVNTGSAQLIVSNLTAGNHTITADYSGGGQFNGNTGNLTGNPQVVSNTAVWDGSASANWDTAANWATNAAPFSGNDVSIPAAGVTNNPTISATDINVNSLNENAARTLTVNAGRTLTVAGACTINGTLTVAGAFTCGTFSGTGTVNFTGAAAQNVPPLTYQNLTINNASGVNLSGDTTVNGTLTLTSGNINAGANNLIFGTGAGITRTSGHVIGNIRKAYASTGLFNYPVGTANGYSPVSVNVTAGTFPLSFNVRAVQSAQPLLSAANSLQRYWQISPSGGNPTANMQLNYLQTDVMGTETNYRVVRVSGTQIFSLAHNPPNVSIDTANNAATINGVTAFSDWTLGALVPSAANVAVAGRVVTAEGRGVFNAEVVLVDSNGQPRTARTNPFGFYRFTNVPSGASYTLNVRHKQYEFEPQIHTINDESNEIIFVALPQ